ncbi:MAG: hypothetical protein ACREGC_00340 [Minisyncoccia bacterium]
MPDKNEVLFTQTRDRLLKALAYLEYSYAKVAKLPRHFVDLDQETLEVWESFSARFARVADLFMSQYLRFYVAQKEPGFRGTMRDMINLGEKTGLLKNADTWVEIRAMRNVTAHEYSDEQFDFYIAKLFQLAPILMSIKEVLRDETQTK